MEERMRDHIQEFDVREHSKDEDLLSREQGQRIFERIRMESGRLPIGGVLVLDFRGTRYATIDCLVEILRFLDGSIRREFKDRYIVVRLGGTDRGIEDSLVMILRQRKSAIPCLDEKGGWRILGELTKTQKDALEFVRERKEATSNEMSTLFNVPINVASNRLKELYDMKLVAREERTTATRGGRHFVYRCL